MCLISDEALITNHLLSSFFPFIGAQTKNNNMLNLLKTDIFISSIEGALVKVSPRAVVSP